MVENQSILKNKAAKGLIWVGIGNIFALGINIISRFILIRLLIPSDFGLMAICILVTSTLGLFNEFGMVTALIQKQNKIEAAKSTLLIIAPLFGAALFVVLLLSAGWLANFFRNPELDNLIKVSSCAVLIMSFSHVPNSILLREIEFKKKFVPEVFSTFANCLCSVALAILGMGVWSLVLGNIAGTLVYTILLWYVCGWKPKFGFDRQVAKELINYGKYIYISGFIAYLFLQLDKFAAGKMLGATLLGYYSVAYNLANLVVTNVTHQIGKVAVPFFAKLQVEISELRNALGKIMELNLVLVLPILGVFLFLTSDLITLVMGKKWQPILIPIKILCIAALFRSIYYLYEVLFNSIGHAKIAMKIRLVGLCFLSIAIYPATVRGGITGLSCTILIVMMIVFFLGLINLYRLGLLGKGVLLPSAKSLITSLAMMFIVVYTAKLWLKPNNIFSLIAILMLGGISYFLTLVLSNKNILRQYRRLLYSILNRNFSL